MIVNRYLKIDGLPCLDPGMLYDDNEEIGAPLEFWGKANSITQEIGREPGVAWILVPRETHASVASSNNKNSTHSIAWTDGSTTTTFSGWVLVAATCVAIDGDEQGAYLLELHDIRRRLIDSGGVTTRYNISDAMPVGTYSALRRYDIATLNGGVTWTWQTMFADLWGKLPAAAGSVPTLPWSPPHVPEAWRFQGESAWEAVNMVLDACQSALRPSTAGVLDVVALGDSQPGLSAALTALESNTLIDWKATTNLAKAQRPATVRVVFRARVRTPNTVEQLDLAWQEWHKIDTASGLTGAESGRIITVKSDLFDERDNESNTLNLGELTATAAAISARVSSRYDVSGEHIRSEHPGIITTVSLGTQIHKIAWRDFGDDDGTRTELWGLTKWGDATDATTHRSKHSTRLAVVRLTQDTWSYSVATGWAYMPYCKVIRYFVSSDEYSDNSANETDVILWHPTGYAGNPSTYGQEVRNLHKATGLWPCKHGKNDDVWCTWNEVSERWELLAPYEDHWRFKLIDCMPKGGSGDAYLRLSSSGQWILTSLVFRVYDSLELGPLDAESYGVAKRFGDSQRFEILSCQQFVLAEAILVDDMCPTDPGGSGSGSGQTFAVTDAVALPGCVPINITEITNSHNHRAPPGSIVTLKRRQCGGSGSGGSGACESVWDVIDAELRRQCFNVGMADRQSCLVAAFLFVGAEFCNADFPQSACPVVDYRKCSGTLPACDTSWTFIVGSCCDGGGSGSGSP